MAVNIEVDEPEIDIRVRTYDGYVEVTGISAPLAVGNAQIDKGDVVDAGPATTALMVGDAKTTKGDAVDADGASTAVVTGDAQTAKGDGVAAGGTDVQVAVGDAETSEGESAQADGVSAPLAVGEVEMEGPWEAPWRPEDRSLSSLDAAFTPYPADPHFYLNFDEPHGVPQRIKDNWQRGTEATYWDGSQLRTAAPNEPRVQVDPETGERYLLAEPQRANYITHREINKGPVWSDRFGDPKVEYGFTGVDGTSSATKVIDDQKNQGRGDDIGHRDTLPEQGSVRGYTASIFVKKDNIDSRFFRFSFSVFGGSENSTIKTAINTKVGEVEYVEGINNGIIQIIDYGSWWRVIGTVNNRDTGNYDFGVQIGGSTGDGLWNTTPGSDTGEVIVDAPQFEVHGLVDEDASGNPKHTLASAPVFTSGSDVTRAPDDLSDLPFNMASGAKSVYFRISQEAAGYGTNEGGNVTNAEVNLTDTPGTAGGGLLRPSTGILGISASGWIDAVVNSTDEDLQGNSASDVVDGLTIQPDKDPSTDGAIYRIHELVAWEEERSYSERRNLMSQRPQPWQELDAPNINTLDTLGGDIDWSADVGIDSPPHFLVDVPRFGVPAKMRSAWQRDTEATYWDSSGVLQTAQPGEPRLARTYDGSSWNVDGVLAEPQRTNTVPSPRDLSTMTAANGATVGSATGIDGTSQNIRATDSGGEGDASLTETYTIPDDGTGHTKSWYVSKEATSVRLVLALKGGTTTLTEDVTLDANAGTLTQNADEGFSEVEDKGSWWRVKQTINNNASGNTTAEARIEEINGVTIDARQLENHHDVATDGSGYADATHATMPILTGGATRGEDKLVMPVWWSTGHISGGYYEAYWQSGGIYGGGNGANWLEAFLNITSQSLRYDEGLNGYSGLGGGTDETDFLSQNRKDGWVDHAVNSDDPKNSRQEMERLYILPDRKPSNVDGATFILRRLYLWPQELTEGSGGQLESLFNHDFSV